MRLYTVYCHTNKINGKKYIGITSMKPKLRWNSGNGYRTQSSFYTAIKQYGWKSFEHEILYSGLTQNEAEKIETMLIKSLNTTDPNYGYNTDFGGITKMKFGDEHRKNLSRSCTGKVISDETRKKISKRMSGKNNPRYGTQVRDKPMKSKKPVICITTGDVYCSVNEASRSTGVQQSDISKACNGKLHSAGKMQWAFMEAI